jgi:hypothetical protein
MGRQTIAVIVGVVLSFLASAAGGYFLYQLSDRWPNQVGALARYVFDPVIALIVGTCVGALVKSRPGSLAALSLAPWALAFLFFRRQNTSRQVVMMSLVFLSLCIGVAAAGVTFRVRARSASP